jgi:flagellar hook assembly protein FlgD
VKQFAQPVMDITLAQSSQITSLNGPTGKIDIVYQGAVIGTWDGTNANGQPASNGTYQIKVDNVDSFGSVTSTTQQATVNRSLYKVTVLVYNSVGEVVRHLYSFTDDPGLATVNGVQLSTDVIKPGTAPAAGVPSTLTISLGNGTTLVWDGRNDTGSFVQTGEYFLEIHSTDGTGENATVTKQVSVEEGNRGVGDIVLEPNLVDLSKGSGAVTFEGPQGMNLTLRASVYTLAGELVTVVDGTPGTGTMGWSASGLASGLYLAVVEVKDDTGGLVRRQILKLLVKH